MSVEQLLDQVSRLNPEELEQLRAALAITAAPEPESPSLPENQPGAVTGEAGKFPPGHWAGVISSFAMELDDLPTDSAAQVDHYLYGAPKR